MCLKVKCDCNIETAKKDIKVYKFIEKHCDYWNPRYMQNHIRFKYRKLITALDRDLKPIKKLTILNSCAIHEGFHSRVLKLRYMTNTICIIPKGSQICYGDNDDIVSTQLIVFKNYFQYLMYKLKKIL